jgi:predicted ATP-grasp superfamily ATP-dependent carboligase
VSLVTSKTGLIDLARNIGIPVPKTVCHRPGDDCALLAKTLRFPLVAKTVAGEIYDRVRYLNNTRELEFYLKDHGADEFLFFQEYIDGVGHGCFALCEDGEPVFCQMHRRVWEYPVTGGPSVLARIIHDPVLEETSLKLLRELRWNGLAMVEFKKGRQDQQYHLLEINPRLWGSLGLSIAAGADFPYLAVQNNRRQAVKTWNVKKEAYLWLFPDSILFLLARPSKFFRFIQVLFSRHVRKNVDFDDLAPSVRQIKEIFYWARTLLPTRGLRYPHGRPRFTRT